MTPLEAAKALAKPMEPHEDHGGDYSVLCQICGSNEGDWSGERAMSPWYILHRSGCLMLAMPQIVAALEAAEKVAGDEPVATRRAIV